MSTPKPAVSSTAQRLASVNRHFSTSPFMAFEVKKLGVVGAGQMVYRSDPLRTIQ
jgi:hypothetical protein